MQSENKICQNCKQNFEITGEDMEFYNKISVLPPNLCPQCRAQLRLAFRNERSFYKRKCDRCLKDVISVYSPNKPYKVWCYDCWFSEDWDATIFSKGYNPDRPFFEQLADLWKEVPKVALIHVRSINSDYLNISADNKDCYMIIESSNNENCTHCYWIQQCKDCIDVSFAHQTHFSYESDDSYNSNKLFYSKSCQDCMSSFFLLDCRNCSDCIGCVNLRNKQFNIFNQQFSKEDYEKFLSEAKLDSYNGVEEMRKKFTEFLKTQPRKYSEIFNAPNSTGNYINNAKNCQSCFHSYDAEDCKYGVHVWRNAKDCMDCDTAGRNAQMIYNSINAGLDVANYIGTNLCWSCTFMEYSTYCFNSNNCFGCVGLRKKDFCILNKQYTKEEYEKLKDEIIASMKTRGEYGDFFPPQMSNFGYNETAAQEQFPLSKEEAIAKGFIWEDQPRGTFGKETVLWDNVPNSINEITPEISKAIFACLNCKKNYRIIDREFNFYKNLQIPLPRLCPDCRHSRRFIARGPNKLWKRKCQCNQNTTETKTLKYINTATHSHGDQPCPNEFETSYSPDRPEILYCEQCYNSEFV